MKLAKTTIAWNPVSPWNPRNDQVAVGPHPDVTGWTDEFSFTDGACWTAWDEIATKEGRGCLFEIFLKLVIADRMDPFAIYKAFYNIDEFREGLPDYMPVFTDAHESSHQEGVAEGPRIAGHLMMKGEAFDE